MIQRQNKVQMYGAGPENHGCADIATIQLNKHYTIVQVKDLVRLEKLVEQGLDNYQSGFAAGYAARDAEVHGALA